MQVTLMDVCPGGSTTTRQIGGDLVVKSHLNVFHRRNDAICRSGVELGAINILVLT